MVLCFHPDDPPAEELHGLARVLTSVDNLDRAVNIADSPNLKLELCLGAVPFRPNHPPKPTFRGAWRAPYLEMMRD